jgi:radical SAM superfamily enzyme YgiQ (UPF0313 family)
MPLKILLVTPPFTQLNTPYPATPHLTGFLRSRGYPVSQTDLGIELINRIFSRSGLEELFSSIRSQRHQISPNSVRVLQNAQYYLRTVDRVMDFLQLRDTTLAPLLVGGHYLPRASRFDSMPDLEWSFGAVGLNDKARFLATLYIEDVGDLIKDAVTPYFGFSRYAEKLGMAAHSFLPIAEALQRPENILETWMFELLKTHIDSHAPEVVGITIPFPGNLYAALRCGQWIRKHRPGIRIIAGGGFVNTELRELSEPAVFDHVDFITLDDGELPFLNILRMLRGEQGETELTRTFLRRSGRVEQLDNRERDLAPAETGCPDYDGLPLDKYLSLIELANPMHRLWSDGRWNKLTLAHGCYWHKCSFCDTTLDYIQRCQQAPVAVLADRMERVIAQTGQRGFHFVDEAAPPALLKELALEILRRGVTVSWWVNVRFEQAFTRDLCRLLAASGCIAATGGLETASDRLLTLMNKGITVRQAAQVCRNFSEAGVLVHAYLMYGSPTQTAQETVDSLEMVRQFFQEGLIQSAFWHRFTATVHNDAGRNPAKYRIRIPRRPAGGFARNDLVHEDPAGCDHGSFSAGLNKAVYNFMHGIGIDFELGEWFPFPVPPVSVRRNYVLHALHERPASDRERMKARVVWLGALPEYSERHGASSRGRGPRKGRLLFSSRSEDFFVAMDRTRADWLRKSLEQALPDNRKQTTLEAWKQSYDRGSFPSPFESFLRSAEWRTLREKGLLLL